MTFDAKFESVTGADDAKATIWRLKNGDVLDLPQKHTGSIQSLQFGSQMLFTSSSDSTAWSYDIATNAAVRRFVPVGEHAAARIRLRPDNDRCFGMACGMSAFLFDSRIHGTGVASSIRGSVLQNLGETTCLDWCSPESHFLVTGHRNGVLVMWDLRRLEAPQLLVESPPTNYHSCLFVRTAPSPTKQALLHGGFGSNALFRVRCDDLGADLSAGLVSTFYGHSAPVTNVAICGDMLATSSMDYTIRLWKATTQEQLVPTAVLLRGFG
jgi:WD40 repeat protein